MASYVSSAMSPIVSDTALLLHLLICVDIAPNFRAWRLPFFRPQDGAPPASVLAAAPSRSPVIISKSPFFGLSVVLFPLFNYC